MLIERRRLHAAAPFFEQRWSLSGAGLRAALVIEPRWPSSSAGHRAALAIEQRWSQSGWHELAPRNKTRLDNCLGLLLLFQPDRVCGLGVWTMEEQN